MQGRAAKDRYKEISEISGMSEEVVRRVLEAEKMSVISALKRGERATLAGRCVLRPEIKSKLVVGGEFESYIKVDIDVASAIETALRGMTEFEGNEEEEEYGIRLKQIPALE